ncbi:MAG TPA: hypothetical protein VIK91_28500 [Nannocystis sp.]
MRLAAALLAVALPTATLPTAALAAEEVTPARASGVRKLVQERARPLLDSDPGAAAELLANEARKTSDPVLYIDAADAFRAEGVAERDKAALEKAIEHASIGLDIAHFQQDPRCDPGWQHLEAGEFEREIARARKIIADSEQAIADLDKPVEAPTEEEAPKERGTPKDGRGFIAAGSLVTLIGVAGLSMVGAGVGLGVKAQKGVEALDPSTIDFDSQVEEYDARGKTANTLAYAGIGVAVVGLGVGIALLAVGVKKRKAYKAEHGDETARVHVAPALGPGYGGLALGGRF